MWRETEEGRRLFLGCWGWVAFLPSSPTSVEDAPSRGLPELQTGRVGTAHFVSRLWATGVLGVYSVYEPPWDHKAQYRAVVTSYQDHPFASGACIRYDKIPSGALWPSGELKDSPVSFHFWRADVPIWVKQAGQKPLSLLGRLVIIWCPFKLRSTKVIQYLFSGNKKKQTFYLKMCL